MGKKKHIDIERGLSFCDSLGAERLVVACNFTEQELPCILFDEPGEELISNYRFHKAGVLKPYEARAVLYSGK